MITERPACEAVAEGRHVLTEPPMWCAQSASLWWIDVRVLPCAAAGGWALA